MMTENKKYQHAIIETVEDLFTALLYLSFIVFSTNSYGVFYMIGLVIIILFLHCLSGKFKFSFHVGLFHIYVLLIAIYCLLSGFWAQQSIYAIEKGLTLLELLIVFSILYEVYYNSPERLLKCIMWAGFLLSIYTVLYVGIDNLSDTIEDEGRLENSFANINAIGMCCSTSVLLVVYFERIKKNILYILFCIPSIIIIAGTGSRKAFVMLVLGILIILFLQQSEKKIHISSGEKIFSILSVFIVGCALFYVISKTGIFQGTLSRMDGLLASITGKGSADSSSIIREYYRVLGFKQFLKTPILGMGMGNPRLLALHYTGNDCYLHCNYAEVAAGGGIVGLFFVYWIYFPLWKTEYRKCKTDRYAAIMLVFIILNLILDYGQVSYYSKSNLFLIMALCVHYESIRRKKLCKINR